MSKAMTNQTSDGMAKPAGGLRREIWSFLLLAFVLLPLILFGAIAAYGFVVWFMQILFWGPPT